jgi:hypothetical protein
MLSPLRKSAGSRLREPFGKAGLTVAVIALVFAMLGGAYAASGLNSKQKKEVKKIAKSFQGTGPAGAQGPAGAKGDNGSNGSNGAQGAQGPQGKQGIQGPPGKDGTFSTEPLPAGESLSGVWAISGGTNDFALDAISFPVRVSPAPTAIFEGEAGVEEPFLWRLGWELKDGEASLVGPFDCIAIAECENAIEAVESEEELFENYEDSEDAFLQVCPGNSAAPEATPGSLCIYKGDFGGSSSEPFSNPSMSEAANEFGITLFYKVGANNTYVRGSWAVAG